MANIRWKTIDGYEGRYEISDSGAARSLNPQSHIHDVIMLKPIVDRHGYHNLRLYKDGGFKARSIARLVLIAFVGIDPDRPEANHISGDKSDNRLENLEWATRKENHDHALRLGLKKLPCHYKPGCAPKGVKNGLAKLTESDAREIKRLLADGLTPVQVAAQNPDRKGWSRSNIHAIKIGKTWSHLSLQ